MTGNLTNPREDVNTSNDNIVIVDNLQTIRGGRTLDVTGYKKSVINAGHVIIKETASGVYKPMPLTSDGTAYAALPVGHEYAGILVGTIRTNRPFAAILVRGTVNHAAAPFSMATILQAVKAALPLIDFRQD